MLDWNPALYRRYEDERTRPAQELLARVPLTDAARVVDLGCGPGNSTELLVQRFPKAHVVGTDNSEAMLVSARERLPQAALRAERHRDLGAAFPGRSARPHLRQRVPAMGARSRNADPAPVRRAGPGWRARHPDARQPPGAHASADARRRRRSALGRSHRRCRQAAHAPARPGRLLRPAGAAHGPRRRLAHHLPAPHGRCRRHRRMGARHRAEALRRPPAADLQASYLAQYERRIDEAYPARTDGKRLLAFPRMFIVAQKAAKA
jgi:trans-aconitate 2-methyltransferase